MQWNKAFHCEFHGKSMEIEQTIRSEFPDGGKAVAELQASEEINKSKRAGLWELQSGVQVGKLTMCVRSFDIKKL